MPGRFVVCGLCGLDRKSAEMWQDTRCCGWGLVWLALGNACNVAILDSSAKLSGFLVLWYALR